MNINDITRKAAEGLAAKAEQHIRVCLKPKPKFLTEKMWVKLASIFIRIEMTQPRIRLEDYADKD